MATEIDVDKKGISRLIIQIAEGEIKIPPLQRPFVWNLEQVLKLLESIYKNYPIGSVLLWESREDLPSVRNIAGFKAPSRNVEYPVYYVLDGQQRLASLYGVFCEDRVLDGEVSSSYKVDTDIFELYFDLDEKIFVHENDKKENRSYFEVKYLLNNIEFIKRISLLNDTEKATASELQTIFLEYVLPVITTKKRNKEEVGVIFERVNNTGTPLDLFDLMVAWTWTEDFHLQEKFELLYEKLEKKGFAKIQRKIILQCISGVIRESSKVRVILNLSPEEVRSGFEKVVQSIELAVDYLSTSLHVKSVDLLPHSHQIVPLCYFFSQKNTPSAEEAKAIKRWFWKTSFSKRYASSTDSNIDEDIASFKKLVHESDTEVFTKLTHSVTEEQLRDTKFLRSNSYSRAFVVLMAAKQPKNLLNGENVDVGEAISGFNKKEYHHIFPQAFLRQKGIETNKINSLCNFCILPADANKVISDKAPSDYFRNVIPQEQLDDVLRSNFLPIRMTIYEKDNFDDFLNQRSQEILDFIELQTR